MMVVLHPLHRFYRQQTRLFVQSRCFDWRRIGYSVLRWNRLQSRGRTWQ